MMKKHALKSREEKTKGTGSAPDSESRAASPPNGRPGMARSPASNPNFPTLPPIVTSNVSRRSSSTRVPSIVNKRLSTVSNTSGPHLRSRPGSAVFPVFHSSLPYALVRDFAYESNHMLHYGPQPEPSSAASTNASDFPRRLSDPLVMPHQNSRTPWSGHPTNTEGNLYGPQLPATTFADGPPWREDEDLLSPVVSTRHRKAKSDVDYFGSRDRATARDGRRVSYAGTNQDGSQDYYIDTDEEDMPDGPGGEVITYPNTNHNYQHSYTGGSHGGLHPSHANGAYMYADEENRYSRDYSFSIASPDEEMHGKAVALFDFARENDNELPLKEGQVLWVSYRHGQGWLVAKDPNTGEDGLVPESYVRLEREIQGGFGGLNGQVVMDPTSPTGPETPIASTGEGFERTGTIDSPNGNGSSQYPMLSHFTTSSKDLLPHDKNTHTPISSTFSSKQPASRFAGGGENAASSPESTSEDPETDEDDTQPMPKSKAIAG